MAAKTGADSSRAGASAAATRTGPADSLDLSSFLSCLDQEIGDLHTTFKARCDGRVEKAFQRLPYSMRRRTASHNAKRVPRRLRKQAYRDQVADNTPSVASALAKRKKARPASAWAYENTKKRVRLQQEQKLARQANDIESSDHVGHASDEENDSENPDDHLAGESDMDHSCEAHAVPAGPRPPLPIKNLRLPTHRWQAKRAQMDCPGYLWNATLVRTPANKTYRMSMRAASLRPGMCLCWDTSYMASILVQGPAKHVDDALALVVERHMLSSSSLRNGASCLDAKLPRSFCYQSQHNGSNTMELGGPGNCGAMTLFYNPIDTSASPAADETERSALLRVHPTIFSHVWTTLHNGIARDKLRVAVRDFRLEIGSIEITGSAALDTLASTLYPYDTDTAPMEPQGKEFLKLRTMDTSAVAPASGAMLAFNIQDPRLDEPNAQAATSSPSRNTPGQSSKHASARDEDSSYFPDWPNAAVDRRPSGLFDTMARHHATKQLPQAIVDKRRGKLATGERLLLSANPQCRPIPVMLAAVVGASAVPAAADPHAASSSGSASPTWTLLAPRACINIIWQRLHLQRLPSGQRPMCAGVEEERHMALERGRPWFPADFPGTPTGWDWELQSRRRQEKKWNEKPTAKRTQWKALDLGGIEPKGELGSGFACDWEYLFGVDAVPGTLAADAVSAEASETERHKLTEDDATMDMSEDGGVLHSAPTQLQEDVQFEALRPQSAAMPEIVRCLQHASWADVCAAARAARLQSPIVWRSPFQLMTISVQLLWGGVPDARARVYRLPSDSRARQRWLALAESKPRLCERGSNPLRPAPPQRMPADADIATRKKLLAQSLLTTQLPYPRPAAHSGAGVGTSGDSDTLHPPIPGRDDLMGFLTCGAHRLLSGKGFGIGHVSVPKLVEAIVAADQDPARETPREGERIRTSREGRFCIVRNAGEPVGHLARWTPISN
ncbi:Ribonucleases P/MRP protein subunit pop1 [Sporothrix epigloea]|uniref:Ribonucleases P/MRP protein subunit pop1 n=1 Tax=Sporothrix epigloea TaxID=1892477 RepID=A0ABP0DSC0_9PEZI